MDYSYIQGGFLGVDVFFVISGFLITSIIIKENQDFSFSLINFWSRRIRRIFPALLVMIITTLLIGYFSLYDNELRSLGKDGLASIFSVANIRMWLLSKDYWSPQAEDSFFLHTWSLSVEEQFYLIYPLCSLIIIRKFPKTFALCNLITSVMGFIAFSYFAPKHPNAAFYLMPSRFWELSIGCTLAIYQPFLNQLWTRWKKASIVSSWLGLSLILFSFLFISGKNGLDWRVIIPTFGAAAFISSSEIVFSKPVKILSNKFLIFIGKISYSLYLWHWPILLFSKNSRGEFSSVVVILLTLIVSVFSYYIIEKQTRHNPKAIRIIVILFVASLVSAYLFSAKNYDEDLSKYKKVIWSGNYYDPSLVSGNVSHSLINGYDKGGITMITRPDKEYSISKGGFIKYYGNMNPGIMVLGDSHALMWSPVIDEIALESNVSISFCSLSGTPPYISSEKLNDNKNKYDHNILDNIHRWQPVVILSSRWSHFLDKQKLQRSVELIIQNGGKVVLIEQPPELFFGDLNAPQILNEMGIHPDRESVQSIPASPNHHWKNDNLLLQQIADTHSDCHLVKTTDLYVTEGSEVKVLLGNKILYLDDDHLSLAGAMLAKERITMTISNLLSQH